MPFGSPLGSAQELVYELLVHCRCDTGFMARSKPFLALRSGLLRAMIPGDRIAAIWGIPHHAGPLRAIQDACRRLGITISLANWNLVGAVTIPPLTTPKAQLDEFIGLSLIHN